MFIYHDITNKNEINTEIKHDTKEKSSETLDNSTNNIHFYENMPIEKIDTNDKNKWSERKKESLKLSDSYKRLGMLAKQEKVFECGTFLQLGINTSTNHSKLLKANFCKVRLCPMCSWRRSLKTYTDLSKVMDYVDKNHNYKYIFLTLTVKNCYGEELKNTLDLLTRAFNKLTNRKTFKQAINGYFRSLEVTYNQKEDTYHPHFHVILAVNHSYFKDTRIYLTKNDWNELWKDCLKVDYMPIIDIRRIKPNAEHKSYSEAINEVSKYTVKSNDYLIKNEHEEVNEELTDKVVSILDKALHQKRLISYGFIFKEIHNKLNLKDKNEDSSETIREDLIDTILTFKWNNLHYGLKYFQKVEHKTTEEDFKPN